MSEPFGAFEVNWSEANMIAAYRLHCSRLWRWKSYAIAGAVFTIVFFLIFVGKSQSPDATAVITAAALSIGIGIALVALMRFANRFGSGAQVRGWAKQLDLAGSLTRFEYDAERLVIKDRMFGGEMRWCEATGFFEDEETLLIYRAPQFYYYIAKGDVAAQELAKLRTVMQAAGLRQL